MAHRMRSLTPEEDALVMRALTQEQRAFIEEFNTEEYAAEQEIIQAQQAAAKFAQAEREAKWLADYNAQCAEEDVLLKKLEDALRAAGITLSFGGYYDGAWLKARLPDGTEMDLECGFDMFDDDHELPHKEG
jgi:hypothetical protein